MKNLIIVLSTFLSWSAFDLQLFRRRRDSLEGKVIEFSLTEEMKETELKKKSIRHRLEVIPPRFRKRKVKLKAKCNYTGTKSKDVRDSNQRMIRRKFNNM